MPAMLTKKKQADFQPPPCNSVIHSEPDTTQIARDIRNAVKEIGVSQSVSATRVLGVTQGTLSTLLNNPKPWPALKSGKGIFLHMLSWLQLPLECRLHG